MFEGHYVTFREEGSQPDALIMLYDFRAEELLVSIVIDEDSTTKKTGLNTCFTLKILGGHLESIY